MAGAGHASPSVPQSSQRLSSQVLGQSKSAREEAEDKIMKDLQALRQRPELEDSVLYPLLAAEFRRTIGHLVSQHAKGLG